MVNLAPIVLFVYNRPWHTQQTIEALQKNELAKDSELYIYSDEAKNQDARKSVDKVREYIDSIDGFKKVTVIKRERNCGLADSIVDGVTKIVNEYGKIIVLEDDLITSPYFLKFMNEALEFYEDEERVYSITGYSFSDEEKEMDSTYFLSLTSSWGWATWFDKWKAFEQDKDALKMFIENKLNHSKFNFDNSYNYVSMAKSQLEGKLDSWAIYWYFSLFQKNGLTLYPSKSLVKNIGFDGSGTHCGTQDTHSELMDFKYNFTTSVMEKASNRKFISNILKKKSNRFTVAKMQQKVKLFTKNNLTSKQKQYLTITLSKIKLLFLKKKIGKNSYIDKTVNVFGWNNICIGSNTLVGEQTWINVNKRVGNFEHIKIGNYCYIGRRNLLSSSKELIISDYVMTNNECKFLGSNHVHSNPLKPYISTGTTNDDLLKIGVNVWIGAAVTVLGNVTIGHGSIIGACSVVTKDIPPFSIAVGNPCKVIKRFDFKANQWVKIDTFDVVLENLMLSEDEYLQTLSENSSALHMPVMAATSRYGDLF